MRILYKGFGQYLDINIDVRIPTGTPMTIAPAVTYILPKIIGKIPNDAGLSVGAQLVPARNLKSPTLPIAGIPFAKRNTHISNTASIEVRAAVKNRECEKKSVKKNPSMIEYK